MAELGMAPVVFSIRRPTEEERHRMEAMEFETRYLPAESELRALIEKERDSFSSSQRKALSHWRGQKGDSTRVFEALWLGRELKRLGIRHVHAHFAGMASRTAWLIRELWGIGYSFTGHADDIFSPEQKPITLEMLVRDAQFIATETDYSRNRLEQEFPIARGKTHRVFNGIQFHAAIERAFTSDRSDEPPRIASVGRLVEKKGFPDLIKACAKLRDDGVAFGCDIVGAGPLEADLRALISDLGLAERVTLHGAKAQTFVRGVLMNAQVFALAAQMEGDGGSDNLPTVIMEAMAAGLPVVSTRIAGIPEMVEEGQTGVLVESRSVEALADALKGYLENRDVAKAHGVVGREQAHRKFAVQTSAKELARLLVGAGVKAPEAAVAHDSTLRSAANSSWWQRLFSKG